MQKSLKLTKKYLLKTYLLTKVTGAKAKKEAELSSLNFLKSEKNRFKKLFENKTITKSKLEKIESDYNKSFYKVEQYETEIKASEINYSVIDKEILKLEANLEKLKAEKLGFIAKKIVKRKSKRSFS